MKVILIEPPISPFDVPTGVFGLPPPHHLERVAGALIPNHDVRIFDMRLEKDIRKEINDFRPDIAGISCVAANYNMARGVLKRIKEINPEILTVMGGHHPSLAPEMCDDKSVDCIVIGEGEVTAGEMVEAWDKKKDLKGVKGIAYRTKEGGLNFNPRRELMDIDKLPAPARHLTARHRKKKLYFRASWRPTDCTIFSRGCPYRCKFCGLWKINHGRYRSRNPELVADEIETISDPYVNFIDDNTLDHVENAYRLAEILKERDIKKTYEFYGRTSTIVRHPDLIRKLRRAGMKLLLLGIESCEDKLLDEMHKKVSVEENEKAIEICHANDIEIVAYFLVDPRFDKSDFAKLSDFVEKHKLTHPVFTILSPFPGTDLYREVKSKLITDSLDIMDFYHTVLPTKLPLDDFYDEFLKLYRKAYSTGKFITSFFKGKAYLTPGSISISMEIKRRMKALRSHHDLIKQKGFSAINTAEIIS